MVMKVLIGIAIGIIIGLIIGNIVTGLGILNDTGCSIEYLRSLKC